MCSKLILPACVAAAFIKTKTPELDRHTEGMAPRQDRRHRKGIQKGINKPHRKSKQETRGTEHSIVLSLGM